MPELRAWIEGACELTMFWNVLFQKNTREWLLLMPYNNKLHYAPRSRVHCLLFTIFRLFGPPSHASKKTTHQ